MNVMEKKAGPRVASLNGLKKLVSQGYSDEAIKRQMEWKMARLSEKMKAMAGQMSYEEHIAALGPKQLYGKMLREENAIRQMLDSGRHTDDLIATGERLHIDPNKSNTLMSYDIPAPQYTTVRNIFN